ncbi:MAG: S1 RNA-binding domain-containing protein, partial [Phycisphaerales bacterium JB043]
RLKIIDTMESVIPAPRDEVSPNAPRLLTVMIDPEKIGKLIGPGGKTIRSIQERYNVTIDVEENGGVTIAGTDGPSAEGALAEVEAMCAEIKVGTLYTGKVVSVKDFGAFIELAPGTDGMCHVSELDTGFVKNVTDIVNVGDEVTVKVLAVDDQGRIKLSRKAAMSEEKEPAAAE